MRRRIVWHLITCAGTLPITMFLLIGGKAMEWFLSRYMSAGLPRLFLVCAVVGSVFSVGAQPYGRWVMRVRARVCDNDVQK